MYPFEQSKRKLFCVYQVQVRAVEEACLPTYSNLTNLIQKAPETNDTDAVFNWIFEI